MQAQKDLRKKANKKIADHSQRFFKTGPGEYAHGDLFLGVRVPEIRKLAQKHLTIDLTQNSKLLKSKYHEERLLALLILVKKYEKAKSETDQEKIYRLYTKHFKYINNWDLVDCSSPRIVGKHLLKRDRKILYTWARSKHFWTRRISIMANWWLIREKDLKDVFKISRILLKDEHDLIHKAVGWMLREAAKKDMKQSEAFLKKHYASMPRTMLRYAIEKFPETKRKKYLNGSI